MPIFMYFDIASPHLVLRVVKFLNTRLTKYMYVHYFLITRQGYDYKS